MGVSRGLRRRCFPAPRWCYQWLSAGRTASRVVFAGDWAAVSELPISGVFSSAAGGLQQRRSAGSAIGYDGSLDRVGEARLSVAPRPLAKREAGGNSPARVTSLWLPYSSSAMRLGPSGLMVARLAGWTCCASTHRNRGRKLNRKQNEEE